jgi:hypothetical protein
MAPRATGMREAARSGPSIAVMSNPSTRGSAARSSAVPDSGAALVAAVALHARVEPGRVVARGPVASAAAHQTDAARPIDRDHHGHPSAGTLGPATMSSPNSGTRANAIPGKHRLGLEARSVLGGRGRPETDRMERTDQTDRSGRARRTGADAHPRQAVAAGRVVLESARRGVVHPRRVGPPALLTQPPSSRLPRTRSSSRAAGPSKRRSRLAGRRDACSSPRSGGRPSSALSFMRRRSGSRSWRSRAAP